MSDDMEKRLEDLGRAIGRDESMAPHVMQHIEEAFGDQSFTAGKKPQGVLIRRLVMGRIGRWAVAAMIAVCVLGGLWTFTRTGNVSWAEVQQRIAQVRAIAYTLHMTTTDLEQMPEGQTVEARVETMQSADGCTRIDTYMDEQLVSQSCLLPDDGVFITLWHCLEQYSILELTDAIVEDIRASSGDPRGMVEDFLQSAYTSLGKSKIDGVTVEGLESHTVMPKASFFFGPVERRLSVVPDVPGKVVARLWVDVATGWPVELTVDVADEDGTQNTLLTFADFQWNVEVDRSAVALAIPESYRHLATVNLAQIDSGEQVIEGLAYFAEISGGTYPTELTPVAIVTELGPIYEARITNGGPALELDDNKIIGLKMAAAHIGTLAEDGYDPVYYGNTVTADDANKVLLRWRLDNGQYRVVFGDLRRTDVTAQELAALETP